MLMMTVYFMQCGWILCWSSALEQAQTFSGSKAEKLA
jgi:hypothetical protein